MSDADCGRHYFEDLAVSSEAGSCAIHSISVIEPSATPGLPPEAFKCLVAGEQEVSKGRQGANAANLVHILLAVLRLKNVNSDVLITLNTPIFISESSAAAQHAGAGAKDLSQGALPLMQRILASLRVHDWDMFGG